jgi:hypothetical protein
MPRRTTHINVGALSGLTAGMVTSDALAKEYQALHILCACIGGTLGGGAPDVFEPALSPNHRSLFHSLAAGSGVASGLIADWQTKCHQLAADCITRSRACPSHSHEQRIEETRALFWRATSGLLVGFLAVYLTHLALDAATRTSLPLVMSGF